MNLLVPLPLDPEDRPLLPRLHAALVAELYKQSRAALAGLTLLLGFFRVIVDEAVPRSPWLGWVFGFLAAVIVARVALMVFLARCPDRLPSVPARHLAFLAGSVLTSAGFVTLNVATFPFLGPFSLALLCVCEAGIVTTAMIAMAASPLAYLLYMGPVLGSLITLGVLHPLPVHPRVFVTVLAAFTLAQLGVALEAHRTLRDNFLLQLKLRDLALRDPLTGLRNRRYLKEFLGKESLRLQRSWHPDSLAKGNPARNLGMIMLDLDHFKRVNDTHGHGAGDEVLRQVAAVVRETIRKPDLAARWGGEEFVILALDVPRSLPLIAAERIRAAIERHPFRIASGEILHLTASLGYAHFPFLTELPDQFGWEQVVHLADGALYRAKASGRNRAVGLVPGGASPAAIAAGLQGSEEGLDAALATDLLRLMGPVS